jgi:hypothetical protein
MPKKENKKSNNDMSQSSSDPGENVVNEKQELISYRCLLFPSL